MILGMTPATFTLVHVLLSLVGILSGLIVVIGMVRSKELTSWTALFLATTVLTSVTGFLFHSSTFRPPHVVGLISLVALAAAILALYVYRLADSWRWLYVTCAVLALYLNVFVGVVQAFQKLPVLQPLAPTQSEPPFLATQLVVMAIFVLLGALAVRRFRPRAAARG